MKIIWPLFLITALSHISFPIKASEETNMRSSLSLTEKIAAFQRKLDIVESLPQEAERFKQSSVTMFSSCNWGGSITAAVGLKMALFPLTELNSLATTLQQKKLDFSPDIQKLRAQIRRFNTCGLYQKLQEESSIALFGKTASLWQEIQNQL